MKKLSTKKVVLVITLILLVILIPIVLYKILTTPSSIGIISNDHVGDFIGYYGAVLGGLLTLAGVLITIKFQETSDQKDRAAQYKPILTLVDESTEKPSQSSIKYSNIGLSLTLYDKANDKDPFWYESASDYKLKWYFKIKNKGRGETVDAKLEKMEIDKTKLDWTNPDSIHSHYSGQEIGEIINQEDFCLVMNFPTYLYIKDEYVNKSERLFLDTKVTIYYKDMFHVYSYTYTLDIRYEVIPQRLIERLYNNSDLSVMQVGYNIEQIMPQRQNYS